MGKIRFDFNNMFYFNIGRSHGVTDAELKDISRISRKAHDHLISVLKDKDSRIRLGLEWARLPFQDRGTIQWIKKIGIQIAQQYDNVISLGIGGSYLGIKAAQDALIGPYYNEFVSLRKHRPRVYFEGNNLDPDTLSVLLKNINPKRTFVIVISKSGETIETKAAFMVLKGWLRKYVGKGYGRQIFVITDPKEGTLRRETNQAQAKDAMSYRNLALRKGVGGRFSIFNIGLLHLAILGVDVEEVFKGARAMQRRCSVGDIYRNPAYLYAALHTILYQKKGKPIAIIMPFAEGLKSTADWYVQLLAESLGKKYARKIKVSKDGSEEWLRDVDKIINTGRTPLACCGTGDLHSIQQNNIEGENNKAVTFIKVDKFKQEIRIQDGKDILDKRSYSSLIKLAQEATAWALVQESRPNCLITLPEVSAFCWGGLLFFFEMATAFEGELLNVNAFDQPGVEGYKNYMYYKLGKIGLPKEIPKLIKNSPLLKKSNLIL